MTRSQIQTDDNIDWFERELQAIYELTAKMGIPQGELFEPLAYEIDKAKLKTKIKHIAVIIFLLLLCYGLYQIEFFAWHFTAIGRILLIKILPVWNWQVLKSEKCLVQNPIQPETSIKHDCNFCEAITKVPVNFELDAEIIDTKYIKLDIPVILIGNQDTNLIPVKNLSKLGKQFYEYEFSNSRPCKLASNVIKFEETVDEILTKADAFDQYFLHFQNCDFEAVKHFRKFFNKPTFLSSFSPVQYSWILANKNYNITKFKNVQLRDRITVVYQALGSTFFKLTPIECENDCRTLEIELFKEELLILTSLWNLEYLPVGGSENLSIILEMH